MEPPRPCSRALHLSLLLAVFAGVRAAYAQSIESRPPSEQYADAIKALESSGSGSIQDTFELGMKAGPSVESFVTSASPDQIQALSAEMPGYIMKPGDPPLARPSADYFLKLAKRKGDKADVAFFDAYARAEPDSNSGQPAYIRPLGGEQSCTIFDGLLLADLYRRWVAFRTQYPDDYVSEAQGELDTMDTELGTATCACAGRDQVLAGLDGFAKALPTLPITAKVQARAEQIRKGTSPIRFNCKG